MVSRPQPNKIKAVPRERRRFQTDFDAVIAPPGPALGRAALLFYAALVVSVAVSLAVAPDVNGAFGAALAALMLPIAAVDARKFIIPDPLVGAALAVGLLRAGLGGDATEFVRALLRAGVSAAAFLLVMLGYQALRHRRGMGLGDVKLAAVAGAWLDWLTVAAVIEVAALSAIAIYLLRSFLRHRPLRSRAALPFGLFLAPAIWLGWLAEAMIS